MTTSSTRPLTEVNRQPRAGLERGGAPSRAPGVLVAPASAEVDQGAGGDRRQATDVARALARRQALAVGGSSPSTGALLPTPSSSWEIVPGGAVVPLGVAVKYRPVPKVERTCDSCGELFTGQGGRRFCSSARCAAVRWRTGRQRAPRHLGPRSAP